MAYELKDISIMVVDDDRPMKMLIASVINALKVKECVTAQDGAQALELYKNCFPDIVITDWEMPGFSGIDLIHAIRKIDKENKRLTPIILMSGHSNINVIREAINAGVTEYLGKPFALNDLAKRIDYVLSKPRPCINTENYYGPDRRRKKTDDYSGPFKRAEDKDGQ